MLVFVYRWSLNTKSKILKRLSSKKEFISLSQTSEVTSDKTEPRVLEEIGMFFLAFFLTSYYDK
jgi:hypothetical protein